MVPRYSHARFLPQRFRSILNQTVQDSELIVLDDPSSDAASDASLAVIRRGLGADPCRLLVSTKTSGSLGSQWLKGNAAARGRCIWLAESDDGCDADFLECCWDSGSGGR